MCLDECTHIDDSLEYQKVAVKRTINWAKRCKTEYSRIMSEDNIRHDRPLVFGVIQGGNEFKLRKDCTDALLQMGFDGYGYGGYPLDHKGNLLVDVLSHVRELVPPNRPMIALGIGEPSNVVKAAKIGYNLFDCSLPTRDARQGRLYALNKPHPNSLADDGWYSFLYIQDKKYIKSDAPISTYCDCLACKNYSKAFLHHLFGQKDSLYLRLATIHNLRFMTMLIEHLRRVIR